MEGVSVKGLFFIFALVSTVQADDYFRLANRGNVTPVACGIIIFHGDEYESVWTFTNPAPSEVTVLEGHPNSSRTFAPTNNPLSVPWSYQAYWESPAGQQHLGKVVGPLFGGSSLYEQFWYTNMLSIFPGGVKGSYYPVVAKVRQTDGSYKSKVVKIIHRGK